MVKIKEIPISDRPIERMISCGVRNISNSELLAILIKTGLKNKSSKDVSDEILSSVGGIENLSKLSFEQLKHFHGIGKNKAAIILASIELGKRTNSVVKALCGEKLNSTFKVFEYYKNKLKDESQEYFCCIYLDVNKNVIKEKTIFIGTLNYSVVHPREIFKEAYLLSASCIICVHNHLSGNIYPSKEDINVTINLKEVGNILGIKVLDHVIIGKDNYYSFLENNDL